MQKKMVLLQFGFRATLALSICAAAVAQTRPPAVPLITHNPYFSIWSLADHLTDESTKHWTGAEQALTGLVQIDGKPYRFMGNRPDRIPALHQDQLQITPVHTRYTFTGNGIGLELTFLTPAFPEDLDVLSRPVTYVTWNIHATDGKTHDVKIYFDADGRVAVDKGDQQVVWRRSRAKRMTVLSVGSREQQPLSRSGDDLRIDWGYFHLAVPDAQSAETAESIDAVDEFIKNGNLPDADEMDMPRSPNAGAAHLAVMFSLGKVGQEAFSRHMLVAYTQGVAIEYLGRRLREYWQRGGLSVEQLLEAALTEESHFALVGRTEFLTLTIQASPSWMVCAFPRVHKRSRSTLGR